MPSSQRLWRKENIIKNFQTRIYPTRMWHKVYFLKSCLWVLNSEFSFSGTGCHIKVKESASRTIVTLTGATIVEFIPLTKVSALWETETDSFMIWTRVAVSISYDGNYYTTSIYKLFYCILFWLSFVKTIKTKQNKKQAVLPRYGRGIVPS